MSSIKTIYSCSSCGYQSQKWVGKCPSCEAWNSFTEAVIDLKAPTIKSYTQAKPLKPFHLTNEQKTFQRIVTDISELDRVLGGGIVDGSLILLGGEPGIGKSTLTMQICDKISTKVRKILYISGEESIDQISMRAKRLGVNSENLYLLNETKLESILATIEFEKPNLVIIDSIQVIYMEKIAGNSGSISQIRTCTEGLMQLAKSLKIPIILVGHVTKDGALAGPKVLEHLVDTVINIEGDRYQQFRILRSVKNRFGSTNEVGIFSMEKNGLMEVKNPSATLLESRVEHGIGSCITCTMEGARPILLEIQALTNLTPFGYPRRTTNGFDTNRLELLIAVLQKYANLPLGNHDVYINVIGGLKIDDRATDLAVALAIISSFKKSPLPVNTMAFGEIGLSGEVRNIMHLDQRIKSGEKFGIEKIIGPKLTKFNPKYLEIKMLKDCLTLFIHSKAIS